MAYALDKDYISYINNLFDKEPMYLTKEEIDFLLENDERIKEKNMFKNYGMVGTKLHCSWRHMKERCDNPNNNDYKWYNEKGITYCLEWKNFSSFMYWALSNGYKSGYTIERLDNNKGYCPENCTWIPKGGQAYNRSTISNIIIAGINLPYYKWAKKFNFDYSIMQARVIRNHKDIELIAPIHKTYVDKEFIILRIWHKDLISVLPDYQLIDQWFACYIISFLLKSGDLPDHMFIQKINNFTINHFYTFSKNVYDELIKRKYITDFESFRVLENNLKEYSGKEEFIEINFSSLFKEWHNKRYLKQCIYHLEELFDCNIIEVKDWLKIVNHIKNLNILSNDEFNDVFI